MDTDTQYCRNLVERFDRDRYVLSLFAPDSVRPALWALYAFNYEIAKTRDVVNNVNAGQIRLTWWHDALEKFYNGVPMPSHDVARTLGKAVRDYDLPLSEFQRLINARQFDLQMSAPASLEGLIDYVDATNTPLLNLSAKILDAKENNLRDLGIAYGLTGILRALPFLARANRPILPLPMLHEIGLMPEQFHHLRSAPALSKAVQTIAALAQIHLPEMKHPFFSKQKRMTEIYLSRIEKAGYDPFDPRVFSVAPFLAWRLLF